VREPSDFDQFWAHTLDEARAVLANVSVEPVAHPFETLEVFDMTFPGFGGHPVKAWYSRPAGADRALPVVVEFVGYGGGRGLPLDHTFWPSTGVAHVLMDSREQGAGWGNGGDTPDPVGSASAAPGFLTRGILDPHEYYYRRLFTDAVRAVDAARTLPGVDGTHVVVTGGSQGGAMALAVAGLVPDLRALMPDVAFLSHFERGVTLTDSDPFAEIRRYLAVHRDRAAQVWDTLSYFDGVNFSKRARAPSLWSVALMDEVVPPSTVFAAFNHYGGGTDVDKDMVVYPYNGHEGGEGHQAQRRVDFVKALLAA
jgi:cephalosporin-C deacetylase